MMKDNKKIIFIALIISIIAVFAFIVFRSLLKNDIPEPEEKTEEELLIEKQLKEIEELRKELIVPLSEE